MAEDVQDTDDYKLSKSGRKIRAHRIIFNKGDDDGKKGITEMKKTYKAFVEQHTAELTEEQKDEIVAELEEALSGDLSAGEWIKDFVHSDNPKFEGKSKDKRKQMALAAYYAKQRNEGIEMEEELKGNQHKLDKNKNGKLDKHDFKLLRKEDSDLSEEQLDELSKGTLKRYSDAAHKDFSKNFQNDQHFTGVHAALRKAMAKTNSATGGVHSLKGRSKNPLRKHDAVQTGLKTAADAVTAARAPFQHKMKVRNQGMDRADARLHKEETVDESAFDWKNTPRQTSDSSKTKTYHDVKNISTGTVYTKQFDKDGMSKGTGGDAAAKAENAPKRGRGRPKKDKFAEAVEFLLALSEETFDDLMEEGFDAFIESFEQLDELSKTTLGSYARKAAASAVSHTAKAQHSTAQAQDARNRAKDPKLAFARSGNETIAKSQADRAVKANVKAGKRLSGVSKAIDRLTK